MTNDRMETRLYVPTSLKVSAVGLDSARAHYLRHVLRLAPGARVAVFNAQDGEYAARIDGFGKGSCTLSVEDQRRRPTSEPDLWLVFAPIKRSRLDFIAEKATELGVSGLWPVIGWWPRASKRPSNPSGCRCPPCSSRRRLPMSWRVGRPGAAWCSATNPAAVGRLPMSWAGKT
jgi:hypothetical protein